MIFFCSSTVTFHALVFLITVGEGGGGSGDVQSIEPHFTSSTATAHSNSFDVPDVLMLLRPQTNQLCRRVQRLWNIVLTPSFHRK